MPPKKYVEVKVHEEFVLTREQISKLIYDLIHQINELRIGYNEFKIGYDQLSANLTTSHNILMNDINEIQQLLTRMDARHTNLEQNHTENNRRVHIHYEDGPIHNDNQGLQNIDRDLGIKLVIP